MDTPFFRPAIATEEIEAVSAVLRSGWLTTGPKTEEFDVEPGTHVIDIADAARRLTPSCQSIMPVHFGGYPCSAVTLPLSPGMSDAEVERVARVLREVLA